ncbi:Protein chaperone-like protein of POR1, chloroplastic [Vitis vinifera]|uniref:Protein chaperone-like protein of POR1, chloroplastic n=1 Tax=Vitis vinifera TaxID=29760 RepID=A0A438EVN6_VITVI|nr:Protein chaperone-like protein of POR1, chloroplastic [Vitis vinifera]
MVKVPPLGAIQVLGALQNSQKSSPASIFPRINIRDPYKRLGISREASEEEIQAARNFLKFYERKNPKIDLKKKVREVTQSRVMQAITSRFRTPSKNFIIKTSIAFVVLGVLTVLFPTEEGPTLQVAISLIATMYLIYDRLKSKMRAFFYGLFLNNEFVAMFRAGAFIISWLLGTFLMVSVVPPILKGPRSLEVSTSLITYVLLWVTSTYLK